MTTTSPARVYVGTYAKYNNGNLTGAWLDLSDYADHDAFIEACQKLHADEEDPELMFQDFEGFPKDFYSESAIKEEAWEWIALDAEDEELLAVYLEHVDSDGDIDDARDAFAGKWESEEDWAREYLDDTGFFHEIPEGIRNTVEMYFDFASYARDCGLNGDINFVERGYHDVWAFHNR